MYIAVTKKMSAAHRMVLDSVRTCVVWTVGLLAFGEKFSILQLIGFVILISGTLVYNVIIRIPNFNYAAHDSPADEDPVLSNRMDINKAITARDYVKAEAVQKNLLVLGDRRYATVSGQQQGTSLQAPLLTPGR